MKASNLHKKVVPRKKASEAKRTKKPATVGHFFFTFTLRFSTFRDSCKLVQRAFAVEVLRFRD